MSKIFGVEIKPFTGSNLEDFLLLYLLVSSINGTSRDSEQAKKIKELEEIVKNLQNNK